MPSPDRTLMFAEAAEASDVVTRQMAANQEKISALAERLRAKPPRLAITCGRGSSDHAATFAKYLLETRTGIVSASAAPSVSSVYAASQDLEGALFIAISQSGKSPDLLAAARKAKANGALTLALVNDALSPLAELCDDVLPLRAGPERSVAATKSFIASLSALTHLVAEWTRDAELLGSMSGLGSQLAEAWTLDWSAPIERLAHANSLFVLGRGLGLAAACESALKLKETCSLHAEAYSSAEVEHGPMTLVGRGFPVLAFVQDDQTRCGVTAAAATFAGRGADVWLAGDQAAGCISLPTLSTHPVLQPILAVQSFYRMANALSVARGFDPDRPAHLNKVTETV